MKAIRLWRFEQEDMEKGSIYVIRGLRVVLETYWCNIESKYMPTSGGSKSVEASWRTAIEDVSEVPQIASYLNWPR